MNTQLVVLHRNTDGNWNEIEGYSGAEFMLLWERNGLDYEGKI